MKGNRPGGTIQWRVHLPASPEHVFSVIDSDSGRASFWAESAVEVDGQIDFRFIDGSSWQARIIERRPPHVFAIDYFGGAARLELTPDGRGGTDLLLTHAVPDGDDWNEIHAGWLNVLLPLKAWVAHRVDLRNHDPQRSWDQGYADQ